MQHYGWGEGTTAEGSRNGFIAGSLQLYTTVQGRASPGPRSAVKSIENERTGRPCAPPSLAELPHSGPVPKPRRRVFPRLARSDRGEVFDAPALSRVPEASKTPLRLPRTE